MKKIRKMLKAIANDQSIDQNNPVIVCAKDFVDRGFKLFHDEDKLIVRELQQLVG